MALTSGVLLGGIGWTFSSSTTIGASESNHYG